MPSPGEQRSTGRPPAHQGTTALDPLFGCWGGSPASRMPVPPTPAPNLECSPRDPQLHREMCQPQEPVYTCAKALQSCPTLCYPIGQSPPGSCVMGFSRQEDCSGLLCPPPGDLPNPGIEPASPVLQADSFPLSHWEAAPPHQEPALAFLKQRFCHTPHIRSQHRARVLGTRTTNPARLRERSFSASGRPGPSSRWGLQRGQCSSLLGSRDPRGWGLPS